MNYLSEILQKAALIPDKPCVIFESKTYTFGSIVETVALYRSQAKMEGLVAGDVVSVHADFSQHSVALLLALVDLGMIVVPISPAVEQVDAFLEIAQVQHSFSFAENSRDLVVSHFRRNVTNELLLQLRQLSHPGLVLFSSGSTGTPKAALHDFLPLIEKYKRPGKTYRTISFLLFDHIGGLNTLFSIFANGGLLVVPERREPGHILELIERYQVELLPTSPTFLNLLLMSEELQTSDLSSLKVVTYGTEVMPSALLKRLCQLLPSVTFKQTYGLSELGIMRTQSRSNDSLWLKVGGEDYETRIEGGRLWIKAKTAMIGYLNAPSPFDANGWLDTKDRVEQDGEWIKILGRDTDIINVGGLKVYPAEVESAILQIPGVDFVAVFGHPNPIVGTVVAARVSMKPPMTPREMKSLIRSHLEGHLEEFKIPVVVVGGDALGVTSRFKKARV